MKLHLKALSYGSHTVVPANYTLFTMVIPDSVVSANTVNTFKNRLDRFWNNQEVHFNYVNEK